MGLNLQLVNNLTIRQKKAMLYVLTEIIYADGEVSEGETDLIVSLLRLFNLTTQDIINGYFLRNLNLLKEELDLEKKKMFLEFVKIQIGSDGKIDKYEIKILTIIANLLDVDATFLFK